MKNKLFFLFIFLFSQFQYIFSNNTEINTNKNNFNFYIGLEITELLQNNFQNLGINNYTLEIGQKFWFNNFENFGWTLLLVNVDLNPLHLSDTNFVIGIEGNRNGLSGKMFLSRLYLNWYSYKIKFYFITLSPNLGLGLGYNNFIYTKQGYNDIYDLKTLNLSIKFQIRTILFDIFYIQLPYFDIFLNIIKNRNVSGNIGDAYINRSEYFGIFSWIGCGFIFNF